MLLDILHDTDSYKLSHPKLWEDNVRFVTCYFECRSHEEFAETVFFGLQYHLAALTGIFQVADVLRAAQDREGLGIPFPVEHWVRMLEDTEGRLPLRIKAVPEGSVVPTGNVLFLVQNTHPLGRWLPGWIETILMRTWYPITVATLSFHVRRELERYAKVTCDTLDNVPYQFHDFGARGVSSAESAAIGGAAHLTSFKGTDTCVALDLLRNFYDGKPGQMGKSIPALEHSIITAYGMENDGEYRAFDRFLAQYAKPGSVVAAVSDTYDLWHAIDVLWGQRLKQRIIDGGAILGIRPDSGDPVDVVVRALRMLDNRFGSTLNSKGFKVLNHVKVVQGDGIDRKAISEILAAITQAGFSLDCIGTFGCGGGLLQKVNRDTLGCAYKLCEVDGRPVGKRPATDLAKASKFGYTDLVRRDGMWKSVVGKQTDSRLVTVFEDGEISALTTLADVRNRLWGED